MRTKQQNEILRHLQKLSEEHAQEHTQELENREGLESPVFIDGIHSFKLEGDCVLIDLFILKSTVDNQFGRERAIQLKMPLSQFNYFAKSMALKANQLTSAVNQTKRAELTLVHTN